jgi:hypothetical protein
MRIRIIAVVALSMVLPMTVLAQTQGDAGLLHRLESP